jgi:hypothetical protein
MPEIGSLFGCACRLEGPRFAEPTATHLPAFSPFGTGGSGKTVNPNLVLPNDHERQGLRP